MKRYKITYYLDVPGADARRELTVAAHTEDEAREEAWDLIFSNMTISEVEEVKE